MGGRRAPPLSSPKNILINYSIDGKGTHRIDTGIKPLRINIIGSVERRASSDNGRYSLDDDDDSVDPISHSDIFLFICWFFYASLFLEILNSPLNFPLG